MMNVVQHDLIAQDLKKSNTWSAVKILLDTLPSYSLLSGFGNFGVHDMMNMGPFD